MGTIRVPGDKSISHRALIFAALADGASEIRGLADGADVAASRSVLEALGTRIENRDGNVVVHGEGGRFRVPRASLDCANSGTTMRLMMGVLSGCGMTATLDGDGSLRRRPMRRVADPLTTMGAEISLTGDGHAPVTVHGHTSLHAVDVTLPVASAQVKSALLLAGLRANGRTTVREPLPSRDHTERMLPAFGVTLHRDGTSVAVDGGEPLHPALVHVPGDASSAAYWIAAASILDGSDVTIENVSLNPTRLGFIRALDAMGADIAVSIDDERAEPRGSVRVRSAALRGIELDPAEVPAIVDELPLFAIVAARAHGRTIVRGARELRVKESDRIATLASNCAAMGIAIETFDDGFAVDGPQTYAGGRVACAGDHRIAMSFAIAALAATGASAIEDDECVAVSYPTFFETLDAVTS